MTRKEKAAQRIQRLWNVHVEVTPNGEYVVGTVSAGTRARDAERLAREIHVEKGIEDEKMALELSRASI